VLGLVYDARCVQRSGQAKKWVGVIIRNLPDTHQWSRDAFKQMRDPAQYNIIDYSKVFSIGE
jgi:hypothetical protein